MDSDLATDHRSEVRQRTVREWANLNKVVVVDARLQVGGAVLLRRAGKKKALRSAPWTPCNLWDSVSDRSGVGLCREWIFEIVGTCRYHAH